MKTRIFVKTEYHCTLERAFKTPMLCDISKVHTGFGVVPRVTHCTEDENWGKPGAGKKVFMAKSFLQKGGETSTDKIIEREENKYWKIEVGNFKTRMFGFSKFEGEWKTTELEKNKILIEYTYLLHSNAGYLFPFHWLFGKFYWRIYMKHVLENIRKMIADNEPYLFE